VSKLILIGVPLGNGKDITYRAKSRLEESEYIYCEDTRSLRSLLDHLEIDYKDKTIDSYHDQSSPDKLNRIIKDLRANKEVIYASEAGSAIISDPAYPLIKKVLEEGFEIESIPGITSVILTLELSGLPPNPFSFYGFFPRENDKRKMRAEEINSKKGTYLFFESPNRIKTLFDYLHVNLSGDIKCFIGRELTKQYESHHRFDLKDWPTISEEIKYKGEFVLALYNSTDKLILSDELGDLCRDYLEGNRGTKQLSKVFANILGKRPKEIYQLLNK
jgi:16S rRNA (cytidine1402-2'-O)-methyltransferase